MGISVNAHLAYGVNIDDWEVREQLPWSPNGPDNDEEAEEWREQRPSFAAWLLKLEGIENPASGVEDFDTWYQEDPAHQEQMIEYWKREREIEDSAPIVRLQGHYDDSFLILAVNGTVSRAYWGQPIEPIMTVENEKVQAAREFCGQHGITFEDPKWLLVSDSDYGS